MSDNRSMGTAALTKGIIQHLCVIITLETSCEYRASKEGHTTTGLLSLIYAAACAFVSFLVAPKGGADILVLRPATLSHIVLFYPIQDYA